MRPCDRHWVCCWIAHSDLRPSGQRVLLGPWGCGWKREVEKRQEKVDGADQGEGLRKVLAKELQALGNHLSRKC